MDLGSLHGTYLNDCSQRLEKDKLVELRNGDNIRFGVDITRKKTFSPTIVKLTFDYIEPPKTMTEQESTR